MGQINWSNMTDLGSLPAQANIASNGTFWTGILYMLWIIMIMILLGWGFEIAMLASTFIFLIIALLLAYAELIAWANVLVFVGVILFMFLYIHYSSKKS